MISCELKQQLLTLYPYRTELHAHTHPASGCSQITPEMMASTYIELGYDALVLTNHFIHGPKDKHEYVSRYIEDYENTVAAANGSLRVILGAEIRFTENCNDYLIYGIDREILLDIYDLLPYGLENFRKQFSNPSMLLLQAHPMRDGMTAADPQLLDGIEVFNLHPGHNSRVALTAKLAKRNNKEIVIAGSDFHHPHHDHEGLAALLTKRCPETSHDVANLLRAGDYLLEVSQQHLILP